MGGSHGECSDDDGTIAAAGATAPTQKPNPQPQSQKRAYVCVSCGSDVPNLMRDYGKGNVRLAICGRCNRVADPYIEYENVLLFLEVMLLRPQVYRHVLYNRPTPPQARTLLKLFLLLVMLDMNTKAYLIDRRVGVLFQAGSMYDREDGLHASATNTSLSGLLIGQYGLHLVALSLVENVVYALTLFMGIAMDPFARHWRRALCRSKPEKRDISFMDALRDLDARLRFGTALCVSSFGKLFALLTVIWEFDWTFIHVMGLLVVCSNVLALQLLLGEPRAAELSAEVAASSSAFLMTASPSVMPSMRVITLVIVALSARLASQAALHALGNPTFFYVFV